MSYPVETVADMLASIIERLQELEKRVSKIEELLKVGE